MVCENCGSNHDGSYGSGRFCCSKCARGFSTKANREEINRKVSKSLGGVHYTPREKYCLYCGKAISKTAHFYCSTACQNNYLFLIFINSWKLNLISGVKGKATTSNFIKKYFILKYNNSCQICGWNKINKNTNKVPLELHHIDGNYFNNKEENLELLCPNCHSLTSTYKAANKKNTRTHR